MKKNNLLSLASIFSLAACIVGVCSLSGCSKKNDPAASTCHIATSTEIDNDVTTVSTYTYDNNNRVISISETTAGGINDGSSNSTFTYDQQGRVSSYSETSTSGGSTVTQVHTASYDASNRVTQVVSPTEKTVYTYNSSGQATKMEYYTGANSSYTLEFYMTYTYPTTDTQNYSSQVTYDVADNLQVTTSFTYDTKKNPESGLFPGLPMPTNNVTKETFQYGSTSTPVTFTFVYNANGYPTSVTQNDSGYTTTTAYTYTNCK